LSIAPSGPSVAVRDQRRFYSGEKKWHTLKVPVVAVRAGRRGPRRRVRIVVVSRAFPGSFRNKKVYDRAGAAPARGPVTGIRLTRKPRCAHHIGSPGAMN